MLAVRPRADFRCGVTRYPLAWLIALSLLAAPCQVEAGEGDFPWAAEARALAPADWVGGRVIGFDPAAKTGVIALYPKGDAAPTTPGNALVVRLDGGAHPIRSSATMRDKKPTEHIYFQTNSDPSRENDFTAAPDLPKGTTACSTGGWTNDSDPNGLNLRAEPTPKGRIVAKLPRLSSGYGIEFRIIGFRDGWFLIEKSDDPDYDQTAPKSQRIYAGRGWVAGNLIMSGIASQDLLSSPHDDAGIVLTLSGKLGDSNYGPDSVPIRRILACNQTWTLVEVEDPPTKTSHTGWVQRLCSNQVTTCP